MPFTELEIKRCERDLGAIHSSVRPGWFLIRWRTRIAYVDVDDEVSVAVLSRVLLPWAIQVVTS